MRRKDKRLNMLRVNMLNEQRYLEYKINENELVSFTEEDEQYFNNKLKELLGDNLNEGVDTAVNLALYAKDALTNHRAAELITALVKIVNKKMGIDSDLNGIRDKCQKKDGKCGKMWIQYIADGLHGAHVWLMKILTWIISAIRFKTFKPNAEQKKQCEGIALNIFNTVILGCLIYYIKSFGFEVSELINGDGSFFNTLWPGLGVITKTSDLVKKFNEKIHDINSDH